MIVQNNALNLDVYRRASSDCTNNGLSSRASTLHLVGYFDKDAKAFAPLPASCARNVADDESAVLLLGRHIRMFGPSELVLNFVPAQRLDNGEWTPRPGHFMEGGNVAAVGGSLNEARWTKWVELLGLSAHLPSPFVSIHDRQEF